MPKHDKKKVEDDGDDDAVLNEFSQASNGLLNKNIVKYGLPLNLLLAGMIAYAKISTPAASAVMVLTETTFNTFINANPDGVLVDFYMSGCTHCEQLAPEFEAAAQKLRSPPASTSEDAPAAGPAVLATLDGEAEAAIAKKYDIKRYPTVLWFKRGENVQELPPMSRTSDKIVEFVAYVQQPAVVEFSSRQEFVEAVTQLRSSMHDKSPPVVVGFAGEGREGLYDALDRTAEKHRGKLIFLFVQRARQPWKRSCQHCARTRPLQRAMLSILARPPTQRPCAHGLKASPRRTRKL